MTSEPLPDHFAPPIPLREKVANALRHNDDCGPGPVSWGEYLADADVLMSLILSDIAPDLRAERDRLRAVNEMLREAIGEMQDDLRSIDPANGWGPVAHALQVAEMALASDENGETR